MQRNELNVLSHDSALQGYTRPGTTWAIEINLFVRKIYKDEFDINFNRSVYCPVTKNIRMYSHIRYTIYIC